MLTRRKKGSIISPMFAVGSQSKVGHMSFKKIILLAIVVLSLLTTSIIPTYALTQSNAQQQLAALEQKNNGTVGIAAINTDNNFNFLYHADQRFPFQSTFKAMLAATVLKQSMTDSTLLAEKITYSQKDLLGWAPITQKNLKTGMTVSDLCAATVMYSDNGAARVLVNKLGGTDKINTFARSIGNKSFNLVHYEPYLNSNPNKTDDTVTPLAMAQSFQQFALGNTLDNSQRQLFQTWLKQSQTGFKRIRASAPKDWTIGDKTGSGGGANGYGVTNDVAILWPPKHAPLIIAIYFVSHDPNADVNDAAVANAAKIVITALSAQDSSLRTPNV